MVEKLDIHTHNNKIASLTYTVHKNQLKKDWRIRLKIWKHTASSIKQGENSYSVALAILFGCDTKNLKLWLGGKVGGNENKY